MNPIPFKFGLIAGGIMLALLIGSGLLLRIAVGEIRMKNVQIETLTIERDAAKATVLLCQKEQQTAYEVSDAYQKELSATRRRAADLKRMLDKLPDTCVPIQNPAGRPDAETGGHVSGQSGVLARALIETGQECDDIVHQLTRLQDWVESGRAVK